MLLFLDTEEERAGCHDPHLDMLALEACAAAVARAEEMEAERNEEGGNEAREPPASIGRFRAT